MSVRLTTRPHQTLWHNPGMASTSGDDKNEPQLELPSLKLPRFGRKRTKPEPEPAPEPEPERVPVPEDQERTQEITAPQDTTPAAAPRPSPAPQPAPEPEPTPEPSAPPAGTRRAKRAGSGLSVPSVAGPVAAGVTGLVVGVGGAAATYAAMAACEAVRGVSTCGGGPGFLILLAIVVLMVLFGALLLRLLGVAGSVSTSFLAVGIVTVLAMLLLLDVIYSPWMFLVVPVVSAAAYLLSHWVTTRFENEDTGRRDWR